LQRIVRPTAEEDMQFKLGRRVASLAAVAALERPRLLSAAAQLITTGRRRWLRLSRHWPWTKVITTAFERLQALPVPG
jgi:hypothetical protein